MLEHTEEALLTEPETETKQEELQNFQELDPAHIRRVDRSFTENEYAVLVAHFLRLVPFNLLGTSAG